MTWINIKYKNVQLDEIICKSASTPAIVLILLKAINGIKKSLNFLICFWLPSLRQSFILRWHLLCIFNFVVFGGSLSAQKNQHPQNPDVECMSLNWNSLLDTIYNFETRNKIREIVDLYYRYRHCFSEKYEINEQFNVLDKLMGILVKEGYMSLAEELDSLAYHFTENKAPEYKYRYTAQQFMVFSRVPFFQLDEIYNDLLSDIMAVGDQTTECVIRDIYLNWLFTRGEIKKTEIVFLEFESRGSFLNCNHCRLYLTAFLAVHSFIELKYPGWNPDKMHKYADQALQCISASQRAADEVDYLLIIRSYYLRQGKVRLAEDCLERAMSIGMTLPACNSKLDVQMVWLQEKLMPQLSGEYKIFMQDFLKNYQRQAEQTSINNFNLYSHIALSRKHLNEATLQAAINQKQEETLLEYASREASLILILITLGLLMISSIIILYQYRSRLLQKQNIQKQLAEIEKFNAFYDGELLERERISRDLHDSVGSMLAAARFKLQMNQMEDMDGMLAKAIAEVRVISHNLKPLYLKDKSMVEALKELCEQLSSTKMEVLFFVSEIPNERLESMKESIYRMVQELIFNAMKHAHASRLIVQLRGEGDYFILDAEDNGQGFEENTHKGIGLSNIDSRLLDLKGSMDIKTSNQGTTIEIRIPIFHT